MSGAILPLPQNASMEWCSFKSTGTTLPLMNKGTVAPLLENVFYIFEGGEVQFHIFFTIVLDERELSALHSGHFKLGEGAPGTH
jgi:hypothetical protein